MSRIVGAITVYEGDCPVQRLSDLNEVRSFIAHNSQLLFYQIKHELLKIHQNGKVEILESANIPIDRLWKTTVNFRTKSQTDLQQEETRGNIIDLPRLPYISEE